MKPTPEQLEKDFWWKLIDTQNEDFEKVFPQRKNGEYTQPSMLVWDWDFGRDFAAYAYELARRADRELKLKRYPDLSADESQFLLRIFGQKKARKTYRVCVRNLDSSLPLEPEGGYSQPIIWRLDTPDQTLVKSFLLFIKQQRELHSIKPRKSPGETSKSPPWNYLEILDKADLLEEKPHVGIDPQRTLRRARNDSKKHSECFMAGLKTEAGINPHSRSYLWPELVR